MATLAARHVTSLLGTSVNRESFHRRLVRSNRGRERVVAMEGGAGGAKMTVIKGEQQPRRRITLTAEELTPESFAPFGQVLSSQGYALEIEDVFL